MPKMTSWFMSLGFHKAFILKWKNVVRKFWNRSSENKPQQDHGHRPLCYPYKKERTRYALSASVRLHDGILWIRINKACWRLPFLHELKSSSKVWLADFCWTGLMKSGCPPAWSLWEDWLCHLYSCHIATGNRFRSDLIRNKAAMTAKGRLKPKFRVSDDLFAWRIYPIPSFFPLLNWRLEMRCVISICCFSMIWRISAAAMLRRRCLWGAPR